MEVGRMPYKRPSDTDFAPWELDVLCFEGENLDG